MYPFLYFSQSIVAYTVCCTLHPSNKYDSLILASSLTGKGPITWPPVQHLKLAGKIKFSTHKKQYTVYNAYTILVITGYQHKPKISETVNDLRTLPVTKTE
jgi:hypothetical protein